MSVTITIANNSAYCQEHGTIGYQEYSCMTCDYHRAHGETVHAGCSECGGSGTVRFERFPFEMNLANANFSTLWNSLALELGDMGYCGSIKPQAVIAVLRSMDSALVEREHRHDGGGRTGRVEVIDCGICPEQAQGYLDRLKEIALEAERRGEEIVWG